jgi:heat shock protein HtpX
VNVVEEMAIAAQLPKRPRIFIIDDMSMNAFATGRSPDNSAVAVTAGLLARLNRDQLQGVVAHEIGHIKNEDIRYMTRLSIMLGAIVLLSQVFLRSVFYGRHTGRYARGGKRDGQAQIVFLIIAIVFAIIAPLLGQIILMASSRRREYLADASAAVFTRYPEGLASALEQLERDPQRMENVSKATAPMFIVNPMKARAAAAGWFSTHPPTAERIRILRGMAGNASFATYQAAWSRVDGKEAAQMPPSALADDRPNPIREASAPAGDKADARHRMRETGDMLRRMNQFLFLACACGMRIKLPPEFKKDHVDCPRCKRQLQVPVAQLAAAAAAGAVMGGQAGGAGAEAVTGAIPFAAPKASLKPSPDETPLEVVRQGNAWMSFKCRCGAVKHLAPSFNAPRTRCDKCGRTILVKQR